MRLLPLPREPRTIAEWCERTGEEPEDDVILAASYLQARGWIFGINFDQNNALELAKELSWIEEKKRKGIWKDNE